MILSPRLSTKPYKHYIRTWVLDVDQESLINLGLEEPVCQVCRGLIHNQPFYFCPMYKRIICYDCERNPEGSITCRSQFFKEFHSHLLITEINLLED